MLTFFWGLIHPLQPLFFCLSLLLGLACDYVRARACVTVFRRGAGCELTAKTSNIAMTVFRQCIMQAWLLHPSLSGVSPDDDIQHQFKGLGLIVCGTPNMKTFPENKDSETSVHSRN